MKTREKSNSVEIVCFYAFCFLFMLIQCTINRSM